MGRLGYLSCARAGPVASPADAIAVIDPASYADWNKALDVFDRLRSESPVVRIESPDGDFDPFWLLTRYLAGRLAVFGFLTPLAGVAFGVMLLGVQGAGHRLQIPLVVQGAEQGAAGGIEEQGQLAAPLADDELGAGIRADRRQVLAQAGVRHGGPCLGPQRIGAQGLAGRRHLHQLGIHEIVELGLEQVHHAGEGEQDQEGGDEEAGVEVPAPGQVVERGFGSGHQGALRIGLYCVVCVA